MAKNINNAPSEQPQAPANSPEKQQQAVSKETQHQTAELKVSTETVQDLENLSRNLKVENKSIEEQEASITADIGSLSIDRLPKQNEADRKAAFEQMQTGTAFLLMKMAGPFNKVDFTSPDTLLATANTADFTPLELALFKKLQDINKAKTTAPDVWKNMFGEWKQTVKILHEKAEPIHRETMGKVKDTLLGGIKNATEHPVASIFDMLGDQLKNNAGLLKTGGFVLGGILLANQLRDPNKPLLSFGNVVKFLAGGLGASFLLSKFPDVGNMLSGLFGKKEDTPSSPDTNTTESKDKPYGDLVPLKSAWKNYKQDMQVPLHDIESFATDNRHTLDLIALKVATMVPLKNLLLSGVGLTFHSAAALAKMPFSLVHGAHPGMLLLLPFIAGGGIQGIEALENLPVPKDKEHMMKFLEAKYKDYIDKHPQEQLPTTLEGTTLENMADIMLGNKRLGDYFTDIPGMMNGLLAKGLDKVSTTEEKLVQEKNMEGMQRWINRNLKGLTKDTTNKEGYTALYNEAEGIRRKLEAGEKLTRASLDSMQKIIAAHDLPVTLITEGDFITVHTPKVAGSTDEETIQLGINPDLPLGKQEELAKYFVTNPDNPIPGLDAYITGMWDSLRLHIPRLKNTEKKESAEEMAEEVKNGNAVLTIIGNVPYLYVRSAAEHITLPFTLGWKLIRMVTGGGVSIQEVTSTLGYSVVPGIVIGVSKEIARMPGYIRAKDRGFMGKFMGNIILEGLAAPLTSSIDVGKLFIKGWYMADVVRKNDLGNMLNLNPRMRVTSKLKAYYTDFRAELHKHEYGPLSFFENKVLSKRYSDLTEIYDIVGKLGKARFDGKNGAELIREADRAISSSPLRSLHQQKYGSKIDASNYQEFLQDAIQVMKEQEAGLATMKAKYKQMKNADAATKQKLEAEIDAISKEEGGKPHAAPDAARETHAPEHAQAPEAHVKVPEGAGFGRHARGLAGLATMVGGGVLANMGLDQLKNAQAAAHENDYHAKGEEAPEDKKKSSRLDRLQNEPKLFESLFKKTKEKLQGNLGIYDKMSSLIDPDHIRQTNPGALTAEINSLTEDHMATLDNILGIINADTDVLQVAYEKLGDKAASINLGPCYDLKYNYKEHRLELHYATEDDFKAGLYDPIDAIYFLDTVNHMAGGTVDAKTAQYMSTGLNVLPFTGTLMDYKRLGDAVARGQFNEALGNGAWAAVGTLGDFFPPAAAAAGAARLAKLGRMGEILKLLNAHSGKLMLGMAGIDMARGYFRVPLTGHKEFSEKAQG